MTDEMRHMNLEYEKKVRECLNSKQETLFAEACRISTHCVEI